MSFEPDVQPLPYKRRKYLFSALLILFIFSLPTFVFYATGYRFDFSNEKNSIVSTGGLYISAGGSSVEMYVDNEPVRDIRVFRNASYIQNLNAGTHNVYVQQEGLHTWVKELPVYPHIVTEAQAFNMPVVPHVRIIAPFVTSTGIAVLLDTATSSDILPSVTVVNPLFATTSVATSTFIQNAEYEYVTSLFATNTSATSSFVTTVVAGVEDAFNFNSELATTTLPVATTTRIEGDAVLAQRGDDVFAMWKGERDAAPYYYCIDHESASSTAKRYGDHVLDSVTHALALAAVGTTLTQNDRSLVCRSEIRIDRKEKLVNDFDFFPDSIDLVLMMLEDGLYVVEIDDRAWQNTQLLYPGADLTMRVDGGRIYIFDGERYIEVLTEIEV